MMQIEVSKFTGRKPWRYRFTNRNGKIQANNQGHSAAWIAERAAKGIVIGVAKRMGIVPIFDREWIVRRGVKVLVVTWRR